MYRFTFFCHIRYITVHKQWRKSSKCTQRRSSKKLLKSAQAAKSKFAVFLLKPRFKKTRSCVVSLCVIVSRCQVQSQVKHTHLRALHREVSQTGVNNTLMMAEHPLEASGFLFIWAYCHKVAHENLIRSFIYLFFYFQVKLSPQTEVYCAFTLDNVVSTARST